MRLRSRLKCKKIWRNVVRYSELPRVSNDLTAQGRSRLPNWTVYICLSRHWTNQLKPGGAKRPKMPQNLWSVVSNTLGWRRSCSKKSFVRNLRSQCKLILCNLMIWTTSYFRSDGLHIGLSIEDHFLVTWHPNSTNHSQNLSKLDVNNARPLYYFPQRAPGEGQWMM